MRKKKTTNSKKKENEKTMLTEINIRNIKY